MYHGISSAAGGSSDPGGLAVKEQNEIIKEKITSPVKSINNYYSYLYYATLVYVKTEDGNYVIPFFERPDTAVNNGNGQICQI